MKVISLIILSLILLSCATHQHDYVFEAFEEKDIDIQSCYEKGPKNNSQKGIVSLGFTLDPNGSTSDHKIQKSDFKDEKFHECLLGVVKKFKFPPNDNAKAVLVEQPIYFGPELR